MEVKYVLELTEREARLIRTALDFYKRMVGKTWGIGSIDKALKALGVPDYI